jgi:MYXO-CTERM domain-containing protein
VQHTQAIYAPFGIVVTDVDPSPMPHDEALVCGSGGLAGFGGAGGVAPFTCGVIEKPITFTFPESLGSDPRTIAEVIAQESAHAWGLEHEYKCEDPMSYLSGCGDKTFQDGEYQCGEYSPRACECGGATQNSYQYILSLFGPAVPDLQAPTAAIVAPVDGDVFSVGADFDVAVEVGDDNEVVRVSLYLDGAVSTEDMSVPFGPWSVVDAPEGTYEFYIVATDAAGKTTQSDVVRVDVTADPIDPDAPGGAGSDAGDGADGDDAGASGEGDDAGGDDMDDGGIAGSDDPGALPPGFGLGGDPAGCACTSDPGRPPAPAALVLFAAFALRRRLLSRR